VAHGRSAGARITPRGFLAGGAAAAGAVVLGGPTLLRHAGAQAVPPIAARLAHGPDPTTSMWLSWSTSGAVAGAVAEVGVDEGYGRSVPIETRVVAGHPGVRYHHALVDGLAPATAGTTYVTAGGGGQTNYPTFLNPVSTVTDERGLRIPEVASWSAFRSIANSLAYVDVDPGEAGGTTTLTLVATDAAGAQLERVTLVRPRAAAPAVPAAEPATTHVGRGGGLGGRSAGQRRVT
jgi:hypothetical protein